MGRDPENVCNLTGFPVLPTAKHDVLEALITQISNLSATPEGGVVHRQIITKQLLKH